VHYPIHSAFSLYGCGRPVRQGPRIRAQSDEKIKMDNSTQLHSACSMHATVIHNNSSTSKWAYGQMVELSVGRKGKKQHTYSQILFLGVPSSTARYCTYWIYAIHHDFKLINLSTFYSLFGQITFRPIDMSP
jgi:hypothetical protein